MSGQAIGARDRTTLSLVATFPLATTCTLARLADYGAARDGWRALDRLRGAELVSAILATRGAQSPGVLWWPTRAGLALLANPPAAPATRLRHPDRPPQRLMTSASCRDREALYRLASALLLATDGPVRLWSWVPGYQLPSEAIPAAIGRGELENIRWPALLGFHADGVAAAHEFLLLPILCPAALPARWRGVLAAWSAMHGPVVACGHDRQAEYALPAPPTMPRLVVAASPLVCDDVLGIVRDTAHVLTWPEVDAILGKSMPMPRLTSITVGPAAVSDTVARKCQSISVGGASTGDSPCASAIDEREGRILGLLARHPFLTAAEIATLQDVPSASARRLCGRLRERGLLRALEPKEGGVFPNRIRHLEATRDGLVAVARREGLTLAGAMAREGFAGGGPDDPLGGRRRLLATFAHTRGCAAFVIALARVGRRHGTAAGHLVDWRNVVSAGTRHARPDATLVWRRAATGERFRAWLEFDRGTERGSALARKFQAYARELGEWKATPIPTLLIVTTTTAAESRIANDVWCLSQRWPELLRLPILLTTTPRLVADDVGPLGAVWRGAEGGEATRCQWLC